jgi:hypothetical protein
LHSRPNQRLLPAVAAPIKRATNHPSAFIKF